MVYKSSSIASGTGSGTGGGIVSINSDTTPAQVISAGAGINVSTSGGTTTITNTSAGSAGVSSFNSRTGAVVPQYGDYNFNLLSGIAAVSQGGTGQTSLTSHAVLLGEGAVTGVGFATTGTAGRLLIDQGNVDPAFKILSGDSTLTSAGLMTNTAVNAVAYPASPSTNTVPVVTSSNQITYEQVPNAALANSSVTVSGVSGVTGGGSVALGSSITLGMADSTANSLAGYNSSGVFSTVSIGTNLSLVGGILTASGGSGGSSVTSVTGNNGLSASPTTGAVIIGLASIVSNSVLANASGASAVPSALAATADNTYLVRSGGIISWSYGTGPLIDVRTYGAIPDCRRLTDISAVSGSTAISSAGAANFISSDTGKLINLYDFNSGNFVARDTFTFISATSGTLGHVAGNNLSAANCIGYIGTDNTAAISNAISVSSINLSPKSQGPNLALGGGNATVILPCDQRGNMYAHSGQIYVDTNVIIDAEAMIVPMVGTAQTNVQGLANRLYPWVLLPGANIRNMQMFCNYTQGINLGIYSQQSHSRIDWLTLWDIGSNNSTGNILPSAAAVSAGSGYQVGDVLTVLGGTFTTAAQLTVQQVTSGTVNVVYVNNPGYAYTVVPTNPASVSGGHGSGATFNLNSTPNSQIGLTINGNDYFINQFWSKSGNFGIYMNTANDVLVNSAFIIGGVTAWGINGCEEVFASTVQIDTGVFEGIVIDASHNVRMPSVNAFSLNSTGLTAALCLGQNSTTPSDNINIGFSSNRCGGDSIRIANTTGYFITHNTTNSSLYGGGGVTINNAVVYGSGAASGVIIQNRDPSITAFTGTVGGILEDCAGGIYKQYAGYTDGQILVGNSLTGAIAPSTISQGANITITNSHGVIGIASTGGGSVTSVFGRTAAVSANYNDYNFNLIGGTASVSQGGTGLQTLTNHGVLIGAGTNAITQLSAASSGMVLTGQGTGSDPLFTVTPTLGVAGTTKGTLGLAGNSSGTVTLQPAASTATWGFTIPTGTGSVGQLLQTDGTGISSWVSGAGPLVSANITVPAGNTIASTNAETAFTSSYTIPANSMNAGDVYYVRCAGVYSNTLTPTLDLKFKFGSTVMLDSTAITTVVNQTNSGWESEAYFIVNTIGASGAVEAQGYAELASSLTGVQYIDLANTSAVTIDTTANQAITVTIQWSASSSSNTITLRQFTVEKLNTSGNSVSSVSNSDGSLTISPTTGAVVASLNIAHANTWTATQTSGISGGVTSFVSSGSIEFSIFSNGNSGAGTPTIKWDNGNIQSVTITGACTLGFTAPTHPGRLTVISTMSATSGFSYAYAGTVIWPGGTKPTLSSISNAKDISSFLYDGSNYFGIANTGFA